MDPFRLFEARSGIPARLGPQSRPDRLCRPRHQQKRNCIINSIKVLLVDDHTMVRQALSSLLNDEEDIDVVGEADDGREAVRLNGTLQPNVVVMDLAMPKLNGLEATRQILKDNPSAKVLVLSSYSDDE